MDSNFQVPKFTIGQKVHFVGDAKSDAGVVKTFSFDPEVGYRYTITSKEVDIKRKLVVDGIKTCLENELVAVEVEGEETVGNAN